MDEAIEALCALGYSNSEIMPALKQIPNYAELSSEVIIKQLSNCLPGGNNAAGRKNYYRTAEKEGRNK